MNYCLPRRLLILTLFMIVSLMVFSCQKRKNFLPEFRKLSAYPVMISQPVDNRFSDAPEVLLEYLIKLDANPHYSSHAVSDSEKALFRTYYTLLPDIYKTVLSEKLAGIFLIDHFTGSGMTDYVFDSDGNIYMILIINPEVFHRSLSDWITYRDNSSFSRDTQGYSIVSDCGNSYKALIHTLMHETSHIYDYYQHCTPYIEKSFTYDYSAQNFPFINDIWLTYDTPTSSCDFPGRHEIASFGLKTPIDNALIPSIYDALSKTPFPSAYGSTNWAEDFAETATWVYLSKKLSIGYIINIKKGTSNCARYDLLQNALERKALPF